MSNDNIGNIYDDMVEESHVRRMKKDAYYDIWSGGYGVHLNPPPVTELRWRATVEDGMAGATTDLYEEDNSSSRRREPDAMDEGRPLEAWANSASVRRGMAATETSSSGVCLAEEEDNIGLIGPSHRPSGPSYNNGPSCFPNLTADQCSARKSPPRQRKEKPTQPNRTAQAPDSSDPAPPTGPPLQTRPSGPLSDDEAQRPQFSSPGPTEIPSDDGTTQQM
ncbi:hypothetical protein M9H77_12017 [Catharanthus roseus]|uniref:Uncharacterized protein n=1 Tax=Catharanthus roseus TaxID=4058 RepID=A0ACC0BGC5_CATRO|nr:hypothetical protein M9H77_12017 [Catharanthus roseus]